MRYLIIASIFSVTLFGFAITGRAMTFGPLRYNEIRSLSVERKSGKPELVLQYDSYKSCADYLTLEPNWSDIATASKSALDNPGFNIEFVDTSRFSGDCQLKAEAAGEKKVIVEKRFPIDYSMFGVDGSTNSNVIKLVDQLASGEKDLFLLSQAPSEFSGHELGITRTHKLSIAAGKVTDLQLGIAAATANTDASVMQFSAPVKRVHLDATGNASALTTGGDDASAR